jgi:hypothetical protein
MGYGSVIITGGTNTFLDNTARSVGGAIEVGHTGTFRATDGDFIFGAFRTNDGDFIFQGNRAGVDAAGNGGTANAIHHTGIGTNALTLAAETGQSIYFFDPVTTSTLSGSSTRSIRINPDATDTGTLVFDGSNYVGAARANDRLSAIHGTTNVGYGTLALRGNVFYGAANQTGTFTLGQNATLTSDTTTNRIQTNATAAGAITINGTVAIGGNGILELATGNAGSVLFNNATLQIDTATRNVLDKFIDVTAGGVAATSRATIDVSTGRKARTRYSQQLLRWDHSSRILTITA